MRAEEIGWARGIWASRERIPEGFAAEIENAEIGADGAARSRRGAAVVVEAIGKNFVHGAAYVSRDGCKASILVADDGEVFDIEGGVPASIGAIAASDQYESAQYFDSLYIATGADPAVVRSAGAACELTTAGAGLTTPPAPALSFSFVSDPANPPTSHNHLALRPQGAEIYAISNFGSNNFERYDILGDTWTVRANLPVSSDSYPTLGAAASGKMVYWPGVAATGGPFGASHKNAYWYEPSTDSWSIAKPFSDDAQFYWEASSQVIDGQTAFDNGKTYASMFRQGLNQIVIAEIAEAATFSDVVTSYSTGLQTGSSLDFIKIVAAGWPYIYVLQERGGTTYFRSVDVGTSAVAVLSVPPAPPNDVYSKLVFDPLSPDKIWLFLESTATYYEYTISTNTWTTQVVGSAKFRGIVGGAPETRKVFYFTAIGGTEFRSEILPGVPAGGSGSYKVQVQWQNAFARSNPSPVAQIDGVPDGATITIDFPQPPDPAATEITTFRSASRQEVDTIGEYQVDAIAVTSTTTPAEPVTVGAPPGPGTGGLSLPQAKYVAAHDGRTWWGNLTDGGSDVAYSFAGEPETVDPAARISFDPNDGDEITGLAAVPAGLVVFKRRSVHVWIGQPGDAPTFEHDGFPRVVERGVGCAAPRSIGVTSAGAYFVGERGVYVTDGRGVVRISDAIEDLLPVAPDAACGFVDERGRYHVSLDGVAFHVWDPAARRWEARLTFEEHRVAGVADGFARPDLGERYGVAGARLIRFGHDGDAAGAADPFRVKAGPAGAGLFEDDVAAIRAFVRYAGDASLIWEADSAAAVPEASRTIALGARAETGTTMRALPTRCYGRRIFFEVRATAAAPTVLDAISTDVERLGGVSGAP